MPHIIVKLWPGKSALQKRQLSDAIVQDVRRILGYEEASVSIAFEEINSSDWAEHVYLPDIKDHWDKLYKKPGYDI